MPSSSHHVIAIDGPAASGKSSVAQELARRLDFVYVNSGAMYRAVTWHVLQRGIAPEDTEAIARLVESTTIVCDLVKKESRILIEGRDPSAFLRDDQPESKCVARQQRSESSRSPGRQNASLCRETRRRDGGARHRIGRFS